MELTAAASSMVACLHSSNEGTVLSRRLVPFVLVARLARYGQVTNTVDPPLDRGTVLNFQGHRSPRSKPRAVELFKKIFAHIATLQRAVLVLTPLISGFAFFEYQSERSQCVVVPERSDQSIHPHLHIVHTTLTMAEASLQDACGYQIEPGVA